MILGVVWQLLRRTSGDDGYCWPFDEGWCVGGQRYHHGCPPLAPLCQRGTSGKLRKAEARRSSDTGVLERLALFRCSAACTPEAAFESRPVPERISLVLTRGLCFGGDSLARSILFCFFCVWSYDNH